MTVEMTPPESSRPAIPDATLESALYARDLAAAETFYSGVVGLPVIARQAGRHVFFRVGQSVLLVFNPDATRIPAPSGPFAVLVHGTEGAGHYCFRVPRDDLDRWGAHLAACGFPVEADFHWPKGARSIYTRDPAGNSVEFSEAALWE
ncbi:MAG: VOC family protein [Paracoccaceae bacterium]